MQRGKNLREKIIICNYIKSIRLPLGHESIKYMVKYVLGSEKYKVREIIINFITEKEITKINKSYLNHNYPTDIITFSYAPPSDKIEAEIFISLQIVKKNSKIYKVSFKNELMRVIIHGCLHLAGYNDKTPLEVELMRQKENYYLGKFNLN